jgi:hypothetical protein
MGKRPASTNVHVGFILPREMNDLVEHIGDRTGLNKSEVLRMLTLRALRPLVEPDKKRKLTLDEALDELHEALLLLREHLKRSG